MFNNKRQFETYNDGIINIYREKAKEVDFTEKKNTNVLDNLDFVVKLNYKELSKREQDLEFAHQSDFTLSLKVKTRLVKNVDNKCKAIINNYLYDVSYIDSNRTELFLYLEQIRKVGDGN